MFYDRRHRAELPIAARTLDFNDVYQCINLTFFKFGTHKSTNLA